MKYAVKIIALLLFIFFNSRQLTAQELFHKSLPFETLTLSDGLSQGMINCMLQDRYGFLWFGTKDGLNRYDGYHFTIYRHSTLDTNSISDNFIKTLYEDAEGRLWIGTSSHGAELFNRETEKFSHFRHSDTDQNSLTDDRVNYLTGDHYGNIWIGTLNGLNKLSWKNKKGGDKNDGRNPEVKRFFSGECSMFLLHDGTIWGSAMGTVSFRIYPVAEGNDRVDTLDMDRYCYYPANDRGFEKFIGAMIEDTMRQVVYLFTEYSISAINTGTGEVQVISRQRNHYGTFGRTLCMDDQQVIWISESDWLEQFDVQRKKWYRILPEDHRLDLMLNNVSVTYRDRSGIIWIGTKGYGLLKYNSNYEKFHKTGHESIGWMGTTIDDKVMVMANGIFMRIFDPGTSAYSSAVRDSDLLDQVLSFKDFGTTTSAVQGANGIYWLSKSCLVRYDLHKNVFQRFRTIDRFDFPVFLDHSGKIWIGTADFLSCFDTLTHRFTNFQYPVPVLRDPYEFLQCMHEDATGILWMGTVSGLLRFDPVKTSWKQYKNIPGDVASLSYDVIFSICADPLQPAKYLWIGTNGGGLNRFDIGSGKCICYSDKDGIPNDVIYGILSDEDNNLWLSTNNGLCRFNPQTKAVKNFEEKDGLQGNEFNRYAFCKTKSGELFFGGVNGFNHFNPKDLHDNPYVPRVEITDFRVRNKPVSHQSKNSLLSKPIYLTDKIILPYTDNMISFDFASFDFTAPGKNLYQYKLDEFDQSWIQSGNNHSATYTNLDPGTYTFRVKGSNSDGVWNNTETSLQLVVRPPWYMMWWFRIAAAGAVAIAIYLFYRYRLDHALRLQAIRNRIAQDLHDEIGSNLSNISIFSTVAKSKTGEPQEINSLLTLIKDYTQTSMEAMSDIVWMINARNDRFENIIVRMRSLAAELFEAQYCHFHLSFDERLNALKLGMEERKNFYLIYKEALNNIVKYANSKNVWIEMKQENGNVKMHIRDDGSGFDLENHKAGNGLFNMKKRGEMLKGVLEMHSAPGEGTTVRLQFPV